MFSENYLLLLNCSVTLCNLFIEWPRLVVNWWKFFDHFSPLPIKLSLSFYSSYLLRENIKKCFIPFQVIFRQQNVLQWLSVMEKSSSVQYQCSKPHLTSMFPLSQFQGMTAREISYREGEVGVFYHLKLFFLFQLTNNCHVPLPWSITEKRGGENRKYFT